MKNLVIGFIVLIGLIGSIIFINSNGDEVDVKELIKFISTNEVDYYASANDQVLTIMDGDETKTYDMPENEFYVSIAPYYEVTHECYIHSVNGCTGELKSETFEIEIIDSKGFVFYKGEVSSYDNGFIDLWLERNKEYTITIHHNGSSTSALVTTFEGDDTCITTMKLS
jgi:hypothetical protein